MPRTHPATLDRSSRCRSKSIRCGVLLGVLVGRTLSRPSLTQREQQTKYPGQAEGAAEGPDSEQDVMGVAISDRYCRSHPSTQAIEEWLGQPRNHTAPRVLKPNPGKRDSARWTQWPTQHVQEQIFTYIA